MFGRRVLTLAAVGLGLAALPVQAVDQADINKAIESGVQALRQKQSRDNGSWQTVGGFTPGATALAALTLLECGAKTDDRQVRAGADFLRESAPGLTKTYSIATAILFFDRLGDPGDVSLIESLTVRLLAGQNLDAGWGYDCPPISEDEVTRLRATIKNRTELKSGGELPAAKKTVKDLPREIQAQLASIGRVQPAAVPAPMGGALGSSDNSNTQFATLALWIGRRHGLPVEHALAKIDGRFRRNQSQDGTWHYLSGLPALGGLPFTAPPSAAMTCAGTLALAVGHGLAHDADFRKVRAPLDPAQDKVLQKALVALGTAIGKPGGKAPEISDANESGKAYYYLWSLERVAMALNLDTIGDKDWYTWGAEVLLANQGQDGAWKGQYADCGADTCFALLFLLRANLVKDISANLKGRVRDPLKVELKGGGTVFPNAGKDLKSPFSKETKPAEDPRAKGPAKPKAIPSRVEEREEDRLSSKLLEAKGADWDRVLTELRETKGGEYTSALALAIPRLEGEERKKAREALAERMTRLVATRLEKDMKDADPEIRRAAVIASGSKIKDGKGAREHIPLIIDRLNDEDPSVSHAAATVLKGVTDKNFGPEPGASREDHDKAVKEWKDWWKENGGAK